MPRQSQGVKRLGIKAGPPTIFVVYASQNQISRDVSTTQLRRKTIRLRNFSSSTGSAQDLALRLALKFPRHFGAGVVKNAQLVGLILKLQNLLQLNSSGDSNASDVDDKRRNSDSEGNGSMSTSKDTATRARQKKEPSSEDWAAEANSVELRRGCEQTGGSGIIEDAGDPLAPSWKASTTISRYSSSSKIPEGTEDDGDLNSASQAELAAAKKKMDVTFQHNLHKPDAPGYLHDVRKDFGEAKEQCDWDE